MPLDPITVGTTMRGYLTAHTIVGMSSGQLSAAVSSAISTYGKTGMSVGTVDVGTAGTGKGAGIGIFIPPPILTQSFTASFISNGITGIVSPFLISALALGYSQVLSLAVINTIHPSVGSGTGTVVISVNTPVAIQTYITAFASAGLVGAGASNVATAIAIGLDQALPIARGQVAIAGPAGPSPAAGVGSGKLV